VVQAGRLYHGTNFYAVKTGSPACSFCALKTGSPAYSFCAVKTGSPACSTNTQH